MIFLDLFLTFLKIGAFTFGGGYAMLPLIQDAVIEKGWLLEEDIVNIIAVADSTPGPFAINISTYVGSEMGGILGAFCSTMGVVLPSFIIILLVAHWYEQFKSSKIVSGLMSGLKPAVIGLIGAAVLSIGKTVFSSFEISMEIFTNPEFWVSVGTVIVMGILAFRKVHPIAIICMSAVIGIVTGYLI